MRIHSLWALVAFGLLACSSDAPPDARIAKELTFADSPLVRMQNASLIAAGDGFTLAGYESGQVRWARVSRDGQLTQETGFVLPAPTLGPYFAVTKKTVPGDQLIAIALYPSSTVLNGYDLQAVVQDLGAVTAASPIVLATLPTATDKNTVRMTAGAAKSGNLGFVAWGIQVQGIPVQYLLLGADATSAGSGTAFGEWTSANTPAWDCLAPTNGASGLGFSITGPDSTFSGYTDWVTAEMDDAGAMSGEMIYGIPAQVADCRIVGAPTSTGGYTIAFEDKPGIGAAFYYPPAAGSDHGSITTHPIVISAASFGDPLNVPHVAWAAPAGDDITIGLARTSGPYVTRFTYQSVPHGSALMLRSVNGKTGPVSAWVGSDYVYVTYTDQVTGSGGATSVVRYFVKVDAPAKLL
jgi:hypothetical protein